MGARLEQPAISALTSASLSTSGGELHARRAHLAPSVLVIALPTPVTGSSANLVPIHARYRPSPDRRVAGSRSSVLRQIVVSGLTGGYTSETVPNTAPSDVTTPEREAKNGFPKTFRVVATCLHIGVVIGVLSALIALLRGFVGLARDSLGLERDIEERRKRRRGRSDDP